MVTIKKITEKPWYLYHGPINDDTGFGGPGTALIGKIENVLELNEVRIQIMKNKLEGYYLRDEANSRHILIDKYATLDSYEDVFPLLDEQLDVLCGI